MTSGTNTARRNYEPDRQSASAYAHIRANGRRAGEELGHPARTDSDDRQAASEGKNGPLGRPHNEAGQRGLVRILRSDRGGSSLLPGVSGGIRPQRHGGIADFKNNKRGAQSGAPQSDDHPCREETFP